MSRAVTVGPTSVRAIQGRFKGKGNDRREDWSKAKGRALGAASRRALAFRRRAARGHREVRGGRLSAPHYDVVIVGYGPVGAVLANLFGAHRDSVLVLD